MVIIIVIIIVMNCNHKLVVLLIIIKKFRKSVKVNIRLLSKVVKNIYDNNVYQLSKNIVHRDELKYLKIFKNIKKIHLPHNVSTSDILYLHSNFKYLKYLKYNSDHNYRFIPEYAFTKFNLLTHLDCCYSGVISDNIIQELKNLTHLKCYYAEKITNNGIKHLIKLKYLHCNNNITNEGIKFLNNINTLILTDNDKIDDDGIKHLMYLENLSCNELITNNGITDMTNLKKIHLNQNKKINIDGLINKSYLTYLDMGASDNFSTENFKYLRILRYLKCSDCVTNDALSYLKNLVKIDLGLNEKITNNGLLHLINTLKILNINSNSNVTIDILFKFDQLQNIDGFTREKFFEMYNHLQNKNIKIPCILKNLIDVFDYTRN